MGNTSFRRMLCKTPMRDLVRGEVTGRLDIDWLLDQSSLSGPAAGKVRNVVKRTRLWRLEKSDVAHELIAHFHDGLEAGTPIDELIETFGDEKKTAKLIRRAKLRQRPLVWHALKWFRRSVVALFAVYLLMLGYFLMGSPEVKVDYLAKLNAKALAVPEDDRAWPIYREALLELDMFREVEWDTPLPYYRDLPPEEQEEYWEELEPPFRASQMDRLQRSLSPNEPGWAETATFLREHGETLSLIRLGAARSGLGFAVGFFTDFAPEDRDVLGIEYFPEQDTQPRASFQDPDRILLSIWFPHLGKFRQLAMLLSADARLASIEGDASRVYGNLVALQGLADHGRESPCLISEMVGLSIRSIAQEVLASILVQQPDLLSDGQLHNLAHLTAESDLSFETGMRGERMWFDDIVQRIYSDDGNGDGRITPEGLRLLDSVIGPSSSIEIEMVAGTDFGQVIGPAVMLGMASRKELTEMHQRLVGITEAEMKQPLWMVSYPDVVDEEIGNWSRIKQSRYLLITQMMPPLGGMRRRSETASGLRDGVLVGIGLELYRREHGDWPGALGELVPGYLPSVPLDRLTGEPVRYLILEDGPVVYSLGVDGDDDGGRPPVDQDGEVDNGMASPGRAYGAFNADEAPDGDWMLWPVPWEE